MPDDNQIPQTFPEDTSIPPIPSGMAQDVSFPNPIQTITDAPPPEGNVPPGLPPIIPSGKPKKKFGGRKMIATILGLFVLIGGIAAGVILVKQQQDIREKAALAEPCKACVGTQCQTIASPPNCSSSLNECSSNSQCATPKCDKEGQCDCSGNKNYRWFTDPVSKQCALNPDESCIQECTAPPPPPPKCSPHGEKCTTSLNCPGVCEGDVNKPETWHCSDIADNCPCVPKTCSNFGSCYLVAGECVKSGWNGCATCWDYCPGGCTTPTPTPPPGSTPTPTPTPIPGYVSCGGACNDYIHCIPSLNCPGGPGGGRCVNGLCPEDPDCVCGATPTPTGALRACNASCQADSQCSTGYCTNAGVCRNSSCPNDTDCNCSVINTPTPTPGETAVCLNIKAYDINWNQLTASQLSSLRVGNIVRFTVSGTPANKINKAKFRINGVDRPETSSKKPGTNEYYDEYTIPAGTTSFTINAQLHHVTLGWF